MSLLKQIEDKGAVLEWSPIVQNANLVALGTKDSTGTGFDDHGGELELHLLDFSNKNYSTHLLGKVRANSRFSSIAWSQMSVSASSYPYGLIAGGMVDGNIHIWNPSKLAEGEVDSLLASVEQHQGAVSGLHFNPHKESSHLLASGGSDAEVFVTSLEHPEEPSVFVPAPPPNNAKHTADVTQVAWNSQVAHILASSAQNGSCFVWDLRQKKAWCELRDPSGGCVSDLAWNPDQGLHIVTASGDDKNPVIKLWDLRSSTSLPLATLQGHKEGVLSLSWCPTDASLLLSCGKDNRTILWDLFHLQPVYDLPSADADEEPNAESESSRLFGGLASSAGQRRYHVSWSPCLPGVVSASSFDRRVQFFSMIGAKSRVGRAPKWLRRPVGATFGFGGKLVSFDNKNHPANTAAPAGMASSKKHLGSVQIKIHQVVEDVELVDASDRFHDVVGKGMHKEYCEIKSVAVDVSAEERQVWSLMNVICFGSNAREELLTHLGFDSATITAAAQSYVSTLASSSSKAAMISAVDTFGAPFEQPSEHTSTSTDSDDAIPAAELRSLAKKLTVGHSAEPTIRRAIIVGNFEAAVECCLEAGLMAEALLLAQCGDSALRIRTQAAYFEKNRNNHPFLNVLHAVIRNELMNYVVASELTQWKETLALLSTYGKSDEFPGLCEALAMRLEEEIADTSSATLCYMCAANVVRTVEFWTAELNTAHASLGRFDTTALQNYVEKVVVFTQANPVDSLSAECSNYFARYAELLANQGRLNVALSYLKGQNQSENILMDRLYHAGDKKVAGSKPPPFPFAKVSVEIETKSHPQTTTPSNSSAAKLSTSQGVTVVERSTAGTVKSRTLSNAVSNPSVSIVPSQQVSSAPALPPGWLQLVDPTSGHPYYVNQATGQSQWDPPAVPVAPVPAVVSAVTDIIQPKPIAAITGSKTQQSFPTSSSVVAASQPEVIPALPSMAVSSTAAVNGSVAAASSHQVEVLGSIISNLNSQITAPAEKKQLVVVCAAYDVLVKMVQRNEVSPDVLQKIGILVECLGGRNFTGANQVQTVGADR